MVAATRRRGHHLASRYGNETLLMQIPRPQPSAPGPASGRGVGLPLHLRAVRRRSLNPLIIAGGPWRAQAVPAAARKASSTTVQPTAPRLPAAPVPPGSVARALRFKLVRVVGVRWSDAGGVVLCGVGGSRGGAHDTLLRAARRVGLSVQIGLVPVGLDQMRAWRRRRCELATKSG